MQPFDLLLIALAAFYVAYAISSTHGPFRAFEQLRTRIPLGGLTACIVCLAPWLAAAFYVLLSTPAAWLVWILAGAGGSVFVYRWTGGSAIV